MVVVCSETGNGSLHRIAGNARHYILKEGRTTDSGGVDGRAYALNESQLDGDRHDQIGKIQDEMQGPLYRRTGERTTATEPAFSGSDRKFSKLHKFVARHSSEELRPKTRALHSICHVLGDDRPPWKEVQSRPISSHCSSRSLLLEHEAVVDRQPSTQNNCSDSEEVLITQLIAQDYDADYSASNAANGQIYLTGSQPSLMDSPILLDNEVETSGQAGENSQILYPRPEIRATDSAHAAENVPLESAKTATNPAKFHLNRVFKLRQRTKALRLQVQAQRDLLQSKQEEICRADEQYIKMIRTKHALSDPPVEMEEAETKTLEDLWRLCQIARNDYGPVDDALLGMEDRLGTEEARLGQAEELLYGTEATYYGQPEDELDTIDKSTTQSTAISETESQPIYEEYLRKLGVQDYLLERYEGLFNEREALEEERERRQKVGIDLEAYDLDVLEHFEDRIAPVTAELEEVSKDVEHLKQLCIERGEMDSSGEPVEQPSPAETQKVDTEDIQETHNVSSQNIHSEKDLEGELISDNSKPPQLQLLSGDNELDSRIYPSDPKDTTYIIDLWLLHKLRCSAIEVWLLKSFVEASLDILKHQNWQKMALELWDNDGIGTKAAANNAKSKASVSATLTHKIAVVVNENQDLTEARWRPFSLALRTKSRGKRGTTL